MLRKLVPLIAAAFVTSLVLSGCATVTPSPRQDPVPVVDSSGELDPERRAEFLEDMARWSTTDVVDAMLDHIAALSRTPLYMDNEVELLIDGPETYERMTDAIESAEQYVLLESYIFADDEVGRMFSDLLTKRSREGVAVKVIYDSFGSAGADDSFFAEMKSAGVEVREFNTLNPLKGETPLDFNRRNHRKILVVDGKVAFTGGINLSSTYSTSSSWPVIDDPKDSGWRDTHIAVRGPAVSGFQQLFIEYWEAMGGNTPVQIRTPGEFDREGAEVVAIISARGGDDIQSEIFEAYLHAMSVAEERIWITQAYFVPNERFMSQLQAAAQRGVDVRVLVPGVSDSDMVLHASRSRYGQLLKAGVAVYERQDALLHAKTAVIDGIWSTVGSSNLDYRSFMHNDEVNAVILGHQFAKEMEGQFRRDLDHSREMSLSQWQNRSIWTRLKEKFAWLVEYWI